MIGRLRTHFIQDLVSHLRVQSRYSRCVMSDFEYYYNIIARDACSEDDNNITKLRTVYYSERRWRVIIGAIFVIPHALLFKSKTVNNK